MASGHSEEQLSNRQIVRLASAISVDNMESIALGYLGIEEETIRNLKHENRESAQSFNRSLLRHWMNKNAGPNQVQVSGQWCHYFVSPCADH